MCNNISGWTNRHILCHPRFFSNNELLWLWRNSSNTLFRNISQCHWKRWGKILGLRHKTRCDTRKLSLERHSHRKELSKTWKYFQYDFNPLGKESFVCFKIRTFLFMILIYFKQLAFTCSSAVIAINKREDSHFQSRMTIGHEMSKIPERIILPL